MLLHTDAFGSPQLSELTDVQKWRWVSAMCYCSEWNLPRLSRRHQKFLRISTTIARRYADVGLATLEDDGSLVWDCYNLVRFTPNAGRRDTAAADRPGGWTYVVRVGDDGPVKIGHTFGSPEARIRALQTAHPEPLQLLKVVEGARKEREMHEEFAAFRLRGEWFHPDILEQIL